MTRRTAIARARRGAAFLDSRYKTWRKKINLDRLDLSRGAYYPGGEKEQEKEQFGACGCVLAQIDKGFTPSSSYGSYTRRADILGVEDDEVFKLGFAADDIDDYPVLTEAWKKVLSEA